MNPQVTIDIDLEIQKIRDSFKRIENEAEKTGKKVGDSLQDGTNKAGGSRFTQSLSKGLRGAATAARGLATGIGIASAAVGAAVLVGSRFANVASVQEEAVKGLEASLLRIGEFSKETSQDLQNFASSIQATTQFGDEAVIGQLAFAQSMGATAEQSKQVVAAAADLASALNIDLNSATRNIAKTLGGFSGELGEVIPELKNLTTEQLRNGEGITLLAEKYKGFSQSSVPQYRLAISQAGNSIGDFSEGIGRFITQSESVSGVIQGIRISFDQFTKQLDTFRGDQDFFGGIIEDAISLAEILNSTLVPAFRTVFNVANSVLQGIQLGINGLIAGLGQIAGAAATVARFLGRDGEVVRGLENFSNSSLDVLSDSFNDFEESLVDIFNPEANGSSEFISKTIENIRLGIEQVRAANAASADILNSANGGGLESQGNSTPVNPDEFSLGEDLFTSSGLANFFEGTTKAFANLNEGAKGSFKAVAEGARNVLAGGIGRAFSSVGAALRSGQNAFSALGEAFKSVIGDMAGAVGDFFIKKGIGFLITNPAAGAGLIAAGSALKVLSGFLGGSSPSTDGVATSDIGPGASIDPVQDQTLATPESEIERQTAISVNIQGDVLDSDETGLRIVNLIKESFDTQGTSLAISGAV